MIEEEMSIRKKSIMRYCEDSNSGESKDFDGKKNRNQTRKKIKNHYETILKGIYCQNCYNEGHLAKECKLLNKCCHICIE
jgi:hypothetical protein